MQQPTQNYPKQSDYPDWHYQPIRLLRQEMEHPMEVVEAFFSGYTLPQARKHFKEMLEDAMCNVEMYSINYLTLYDSIEKLIEAAWLLLQQNEIQNTTLPSLLPADTGLNKLVELLAATLRPERIFLLSGKESTMTDLLIIVPDNTGKSFSHYGTLIETLSYGSNLSFSLHASSSFHQHMVEAHPFWLSCCREKNQVYTTVDTPFPHPVPEKINALKERVNAIFLTGMGRSCSFLESAQANRQGCDSAVLLFMLHQSVELVFRAVIFSFTGTEVREHSIAVLKKHLRRCAPQLFNFFPADTEEEKALLSLLDSAYRKGRYDESFSPGEEILNRLFQRIERLHDIGDAVFADFFRSLPE